MPSSSTICGERVDLFDARELRFVDDQDVDAVATQPVDVRREVAARCDRLGEGFDADPTRHHPLVTAVTEGPQRDVASALAQLPAELQRERRLTGRHGSVGEGQFWHGPLVVDSNDQRYRRRRLDSGPRERGESRICALGRLWCMDYTVRPIAYIRNDRS